MRHYSLSVTKRKGCQYKLGNLASKHFTRHRHRLLFQLSRGDKCHPPSSGFSDEAKALRNRTMISPCDETCLHASGVKSLAAITGTIFVTWTQNVPKHFLMQSSLFSCRRKQNITFNRSVQRHLYNARTLAAPGAKKIDFHCKTHAPHWKYWKLWLSSIQRLIMMKERNWQKGGK